MKPRKSRQQIFIHEPRLCGYVRGSTEEQLITLDAQQHELRRYCEANEFELVRIFVDSGTSGESAFFERPVIQEMLEYMRVNRITQFAFVKLDRVFRNIRDCVNTIDELQHRNIAIHATQQKLDTSSAMGRAFVHFTALVAELENGIRSERQIAAFDTMRRQHQRIGTVPYGWDSIADLHRVTKTGRQAETLLPNQREQEVLRWMLAKHKAGHSYNKIAEALNSAQIRPKKGALWYPSSVSSVLTNAKLADEPAQPQLAA